MNSLFYCKLKAITPIIGENVHPSESFFIKQTMVNLIEILNLFQQYFLNHLYGQMCMYKPIEDRHS